MGGLELTDIQKSAATQRLGRALFGHGNDNLNSGGERVSYAGSGIDKIQDGKVSSRLDMYIQRNDYTRRWH